MLYRFSDFELDPERYRLRRGGRPIRIEPRVLEVLAYLVRHRERTVSRAELLETVWPQEHVSESALKRTIRELRRTLEDSASRPRFLETVHGRGYVFLGEVAEVADAEARSAPARPASVSPSAETDATRPIDAPHSRSPLVGREPEMATLVAALEDALSGRGRLVMLVGEPGIGKTRTAQALSVEAERRGVRALWGRSVEGWRAPPYWPWVVRRGRRSVGSVRRNGRRSRRHRRDRAGSARSAARPRSRADPRGPGAGSTR